MKPASCLSMWIKGAALGGLVVLASCDQELAQPARDHRQVETATAGFVAPEPGERAAPSPRPRAGQAPDWADSRRYSAEDNARYQFEQHGAEVGAQDVDAFVKAVHAFLDDPPDGAKTAVRANGDRLVFDPDSGLFGVARSDGAPRILFRPDDGEAYWADQLREIQTARSGGGEG